MESPVPKKNSHGVPTFGRVKIDYRIGECPQFYSDHWDRPLMRVPDKIKKCVGFLAYVGKEDRIVINGTVFFVAMEEGGEMFTYAVTAKHILLRLKEKGKTEVFLRLNAVGRGAELHTTNLDQWFFHQSDLTTDCAVLPFSPEKDYEFLSFPLKAVATPERIKAYGIGIGDNVFIAGLFGRHTGKDKNIPIVRTGIIAAMPDEPVETKRGEMEGYLAELRSIDGLSGSPVFVSIDNSRMYGETIEFDSQGMFYLLGLIHGRWDVRHITAIEHEIDADDSDSLRQPLNSGIGIVVPIHKVIEIINRPELVEMRNAERERRRLERCTTED